MITKAAGRSSFNVLINVSDIRVGHIEENILQVSESESAEDAASNLRSQDIASMYDSISSTVVDALMLGSFKRFSDMYSKLRSSSFSGKAETVLARFDTCVPCAMRDPRGPALMYGIA